MFSGPITKQFPLCLLPGIQGSHDLDSSAYQWNGFINVDLNDPKNNITVRLFTRRTQMLQMELKFVDDLYV